MTIRTRMAPSPTGEYHIGSMRTLLYNYALAKKEGGQFILRIEDTDRERFVEGATERLIDVIHEYGLNWDEGPVVGGPHAPYIQSERLDIYKKYALELVEGGHAYYCFCTKERLEQIRKEQQAQGKPSTKYDKFCLSLSKEEVGQKLDSGVSHVIRLNVHPNEEVLFEDKVLGQISFPTNDIDDQVLLKSDGFPTYHLAVVVDDHLMQINYVVRGVEWLPSTPKHILLYKAFGWELPVYAHLPLLKEKGDTKKLSKRMGSVSAEEFLAEGYLPEATLNLLMFLGWNPGTEKEIYTLEEFIKDFSIERVHKTDLVVFDREKLAWYNGYYIRNIPTPHLLDKLKTWSQKYDEDLKTNGKDEKYILGVLEIIKDRMKTLRDFAGLSSYFFTTPHVTVELLTSFAKENTAKLLMEFINLYKKADVENWNAKYLDEISHKFLEENQYKPKEAFMTLRAAVTGTESTPPLFEVLNILGKETTLQRLKSACGLIKGS